MYIHTLHEYSTASKIGKHFTIKTNQQHTRICPPWSQDPWVTVYDNPHGKSV